MRKHIFNIALVLIFFIGLSLLLYPMAANTWNTYRQSQLITQYDEKVADLEASGSIDYEAEWERARAYNAALKPSILPDSFAIAEAKDGIDNDYESVLNITEDGMMGTVEIPKIDVKLPIYHYTTEEVLARAAGHLAGSSLPIGGDGSHCVISAHRGLPSATLFTDLDKLEEGDHFMLHILDGTLCYQVDKISVIDPEDTEELSVVEGKDYVTLLTCTPYGVNSHRLLVRGHRVPYEESYEEETSTSVSLHTNYLLWVIVGLGLTTLVIAIMIMRERKKNRSRRSRHEE